MKRKILFSGIDGTGKSTSLDLLISKFDSRYRILKISYNAGYVYRDGEKTDVFETRMNRIVEATRQISRRYRCYSIFLVFNFAYKCLRMKYFEIFKPCDLLLYDTDTIIRPAVHITFHFPLMRLISHRARLKVTSVIFGAKKDATIFFLDAHPAIAMKRIISRGKPLEAHETRDHLETLRREFHKVVSVASQSGYHIIKIDTDDKEPEEIVNEMELTLSESLKRDFDQVPGVQ